jgi:hypothetical protein
MRRRRVSALWLWLGLGLGIALGLAVTWLIWPRLPAYTDLAHVRRIYQEDYVLMVSTAYEQDSDLPRAQARLAYLGNAQHVRQLVTGLAEQVIEQENDLILKRRLAHLASALGAESAAIIAYVATPVPEAPAPTEILALAATETPTVPVSETPTPRVSETRTPTSTSVTRKVTATPTRAAEYRLVEAKPSSCRENARPGYILIDVQDTLGQGLPGVHVVVSWASGQDEFVTGLHPDQDPGYADYAMSPGISYTVTVAEGSSDSAEDLEAFSPEKGCPEPDKPGSWEVVFQRRDERG